MLTVRILQEGDDYDSGPYNVTFIAGTTSVSFDVPIIDDDIVESRETFNLAVTSSSLPNNVYRGVPNVTTVTILDDEGTFLFRINCCVNNLWSKQVLLCWYKR